jgi:Icc protein
MAKYTLPKERARQEYEAERERWMAKLPQMNRRDFFRTAAQAAAAATVAWKGFPPHSFQLVKVAEAKETPPKFTFAYVSDSHILNKGMKHRFIRACQKAVQDVNALDPQPDFVLFGGDLAQLGQAEELSIGQQILKDLKAPVRMMVGEHDWYFDMGEKWREMFGAPTYSFDHKGVHFIVLNSVIVEDYWTEPKMTPMQRMLAMAQLDNPHGRPFTVGEAQRDWLTKDLAKVDKKTPLIVFSHSPLYKYYRSGAEDPGAVFHRHGHPRPHPPTAHQPHQEHHLSRRALDSMAVAVRAQRAAAAHRRDGARRPLQPVRRLRLGHRDRAGEWAGELTL